MFNNSKKHINNYRNKQNTTSQKTNYLFNIITTLEQKK